MQKIISYIVINLFSLTIVLAQHDVREQVYIHLNSQAFISGETVHFAAYCNSLQTGKPSGLSKILYVEIIGEKGPVHQQKVYMDKGRGNSDFFIQSTVSSGQYYLIAYTRWMKNFNDFFLCPVLIINPYESYPNEQKVGGPQIDLFPLHDPLVAGCENTVAFYLKAENPQEYKGRIVDHRGELVSTIKPGRFGLGKMRFIPRKGSSYRLILEDSDQSISFFDFPPVAEEGSFVMYREENGRLNLKCVIAGEPDSPLSLTLFANGSILCQAEVLPNTFYTVPGKALPDGFYRATYSDKSGMEIAARRILISNGELKKDPAVKIYGIRENVAINTLLDSGDYSISVRKKISPEFDSHRHAILSSGLDQVLRYPALPSVYLSSVEGDAEILMITSESLSLTLTPERVHLLPEIREEILTGNITDNEGNPAAGQKISLSFPGTTFQLRVGESNKTGDFFIPFQSSASDTEAVLAAVDFQNRYVIKTQSPFLSSYPKFDYQLPSLDSSLVKKILEKNIRVQIENVYFQPSQENMHLNQWVEEIPYHTTYLLDDYKRFPTLKETFTEYIVTANVRESRDPVIKTTYFPGLFQKEYPPLVLLDGVPVSGKDVVQLNSYKVKSIGVLPNRYFMGPLIIDGVVGLSTFSGDLGGVRLDLGGNHMKVPIMKASYGGVHDFPDYSDGGRRNIADQRDQLYWNPAFRPAPGKSEISFYTSDVPGEYEVVIEGFTDHGKPVTRVYDFVVK